MLDISIKMAQIAQQLDGQVVSNPVAFKTCIKGLFAGFPITLEIPHAAYPFGINYYLETSGFVQRRKTNQFFKLTLLPKYARGKLSAMTRFLFFERRGQKLESDELDKKFICKYDNAELTKFFVHHIGVDKNILALENVSHFSELIIKSDAGLYLMQPVSFHSLDLQHPQEIFSLLAKLGEVLFETF